ncbi:MAG: pilus assembly protein PilF, partial [Deltaproteobacteria bacterium]
MNRLCCSAFIFIFLFLIAGCSSDQEKAENFIKEANTYFEQQDYNKAKIQIKNAINLSPESIEAYTLLIQTNLKLKEAQEAFSALLRLEQLDPDNLETKIQLASFYLLGKKRIEAEKKIEEVLAKDPDNIQGLYLHAGALASKKEEIETVKQVYVKILELDPKQSKAMVVLARICQAQGELDQAENYIKTAVKVAPDNIALYKTLFGFYLSQKAFDPAKNVLEDLIAQRPDEVEPRIMLG